MRRNEKRVLILLYSIRWWGLLLAGVAGYVMLFFLIPRASLARPMLADTVQALATLWFALCTGAGLFGAVSSFASLIGRLRNQDRSTSAGQWTGGRE